MRSAVPLAILTLLLFIGTRPLGPLPPLGPLLDPARGVWNSGANMRSQDGESIVLRGARAAVEVVIDVRGVPHVFATNEEDAYRALGYLVARDRLFQMEIQTRATAGRLTEWVGSVALDADRSSRRLGLVWAAERKLAAYDTTSSGYKAMVAYAEGVNAYIRGLDKHSLPLEYRLLGKKPIAWEPIHTLYFFGRMANTLALNDASFRRLAAQARVGREAADALYPVNSPIQEPIQPNGERRPRFDFAELPPPGGPDAAAQVALDVERFLLGVRVPVRGNESDAVGSNNWAVSPERSASGHALLAGDPHLELSLPSVWYEMHVNVAGKLDVAGVGFPGVPGVIIGFNRDVAWSFTNTNADVNDYYRETVDNATAPTRYRLDGKWVPLQARLERFRDKSGKVIHTDTLYFNHRGPVTQRGGEWFSMRWTAHQPSHEMDNFLRLGYTRNVTDWMNAFSDYVAPAQNGVVADRTGNIAIRSTGLYPVRPGDGRGDVIRDGSLSSSDWQGAVPVSAFPFALNPAQGFVASANQQPVDPRASSAYIGSDWFAPWRAIRINQLLRADPAATPDAMRRYQVDPRSARADAFVPVFLNAATATRAGGRRDVLLDTAAALLAQWDRTYTRTNNRAVLFEAAMTELAERTWDEIMPHDSGPARERAFNMPESSVLLQLTRSPASPWWDDRRTAATTERRDDIVAASLRAAYADLLKTKGPADGQSWIWTNARKTNIYHLMRLPSFSALNLPVAGGPATLSPMDSRGTAGASWRMVVELGPDVRAWGIYPGGQTGNPTSRGYTDRVPRWLDGKLDRIAFPRTAAELPSEQVSARLRFLPRA